MSTCRATVLACVAILPLVVATPAPGIDVDGDGVADAVDVCPNTPFGILVDTEGRPLANLDADCDVDLKDVAILQGSFTGLDDLALLARNMTGPLGCGTPVSNNDIELRFALRRQKNEEATACTVPSSVTSYLKDGCFLMEVYAADTRPDPRGITCVFFDVDLSDSCGLFSTGFAVENAFPDFQGGGFVGAHRVEEVGGCTTEAGVGVGQWVLVATIDVIATHAACSTAVALQEADAASSVFGAGIRAQVGLGQPIDVNVTCTGVIYDIWPLGGDGFIDGGDRSMLIPCLGKTAPFSPDCERLDWNCDGVIDKIDTSFFDSAFDLPICAGGIDIPPCQLSCR